MRFGKLLWKLLFLRVQKHFVNNIKDDLELYICFSIKLNNCIEFNQ